MLGWLAGFCVLSLLCCSTVLMCVPYTFIFILFFHVPFWLGNNTSTSITKYTNIHQSIKYASCCLPYKNSSSLPFLLPFPTAILTHLNTHTHTHLQQPLLKNLHPFLNLHKRRDQVLLHHRLHRAELGQGRLSQVSRVCVCVCMCVYVSLLPHLCV